MRIALSLLVVLGCAKKPASSEPSADFKHDVAVFCGALDEGPMEGLPDLGPRILSRIRTDEFKRLFDMRQSDPDPAGALFTRLENAAQRSGVARCPTLDWMKNGFR